AHIGVERPTAALRANFRICGSINASSFDHGATATISARNTSRFVRFFFPAKPSDEKLSCASILSPPNQGHSVPCSTLFVQRSRRKWRADSVFRSTGPLYSCCRPARPSSRSEDRAVLLLLWTQHRPAEVCT